MNNNQSKLHILFHRPTPWQSDIQCSTKVLAQKFSEKGFNVSYLEDPMDVGHLIKWKGYYHVWKNAPRWENAIWIINPFSLIPFRDIFPFNTKLAAYIKYCFCMPSIKSLLRRSDRKDPDIIWTTVPGSSALRKKFPDALLVFHVIDYYPAFRGEDVKKLEKQDYEAASHVFLIGHALHSYLTDDLEISEDKITVLGQGVALEKYQAEFVEPEDIATAPSPRAIWCGVTKKGDEELFMAATKRMHILGGSMIFIGSECEWLKNLKNKFPKTVYVLGSKPSEKVPAYLMSSDIGLMLYDRSRAEVYEGQNPLKLYEYAAAGLPIISTPHSEFNHTQPPVMQVESEQDIAKAIDIVISNHEKMRCESLKFSQESSWDSKVQFAKDILISLMKQAKK